jgi:hypothetical protein
MLNCNRLNYFPLRHPRQGLDWYENSPDSRRNALRNDMTSAQKLELQSLTLSRKSPTAILAARPSATANSGHPNDDGISMRRQQQSTYKARVKGMSKASQSHTTLVKNMLDSADDDEAVAHTIVHNLQPDDDSGPEARPNVVGGWITGGEGKEAQAAQGENRADGADLAAKKVDQDSNSAEHKEADEPDEPAEKEEFQADKGPFDFKDWGGSGEDKVEKVPVLEPLVNSDPSDSSLSDRQVSNVGGWRMIEFFCSVSHDKG